MKGEPSIKALDTYAARLKTIKVVDPACGSGAFLITVLRYLVEAWHEVQGLRRQVGKGLADRNADDVLIAEILKTNIYGVDINPASVEIARLALWLHTARGDKPLSSLNENIREGNSLIGTDFYKGQVDLALYDHVQKERICAFDWEVEFSDVFSQGGFDAVVGNPPYVKLQNFRTVHADMAEFLRDGRPEIDLIPYMSTRSGNFDIYLPFIEKGIELLNENGRLGYIAPSLWIINQHGKGLRALVAEHRYLDRWIDFKAYQVFEESITYTALQFFSKKPNAEIRVAEAPTGDLPENPWGKHGQGLRYGRQNFGDRWLLLTGDERTLIDRLYERAKQLGDASHSKGILVGLQTSADYIYHLTKIGRGTYLCSPKGENSQPPYEVELEEEIMRPLISGPEAKRYEPPITDTYLLFPYVLTSQGVALMDAQVMENKYPKAWKHLCQYKNELTLREVKKNRAGETISAPFDDSQWYRFGRNQNLDKQEFPKLIVAQTVPEMRVCFDETASFYLNNVRVNGILPAKGQDPWFLLGVLNSNVIDFVFRRIAKVKAGGYFEANKQFIAPLPIPNATPRERTDVASKARALQAAHGRRRDTLTSIARRLSAARVRIKPEIWLFPDLKSARDLLTDAPMNLTSEKREDWADQQYRITLDARYAAITARLTPTATLTAAMNSGELVVLCDGIPIIDRIFVDQTQGEFILAQWKVLLASFVITESADGKRLSMALRKIAATDNAVLVQQVIELERELGAIDNEIALLEKETNALVSKLFRLSAAELRILAGNATADNPGNSLGSAY